MAKLGFRVMWPVNRLPQLKLPSQKGNQWAPKGDSPLSVRKVPTQGNRATFFAMAWPGAAARPEQRAVTLEWPVTVNSQ